jgi:predicted PurR-regulated permease PerM
MNGLIFFIGLLILLSIGRGIFVPILLAIFFWYLINAIAAYYRKALPYSKSMISGITASVLAVSTFAGLIYMFATRVRPMFTSFSARLPEIQTKLQSLLAHIGADFGISVDLSSSPLITDLAHGAGNFVFGFASVAGIVMIYVFFMFIEQSTFRKKLTTMFPHAKEFKKISFIMQSIDDNMKKYLFMKTFISAMTGILSYFLMHWMGLEFAGVWAFIIFVLNYIPTFGSIVACILPIAYSLIQFDTMRAPIMIAFGLVVLQILLGNVIEPRLTGKTLNLSTLAILINLVFWGILWGPIGAFFSVPLLVATFVITAQFDKTRWIAILLSANGEIPDVSD